MGAAAAPTVMPSCICRPRPPRPHPEPAPARVGDGPSAGVAAGPFVAQRRRHRRSVGPAPYRLRMATIAPPPSTPAPPFGQAPNPQYRGPLAWLEGAPSTDELLFMGGLSLVGALLLLLGFRLLLSYGRGWTGPMRPSHGRLGAAIVSAAAGASLLFAIWLRLDSIAARMGLPVLVLIFYLWAELPSRSRRR